MNGGKVVCGNELDEKVRAILVAATRRTVLRATSDLITLGFNAHIAFTLVAECVAARGNARQKVSR